MVFLKIIVSLVMHPSVLAATSSGFENIFGSRLLKHEEKKDAVKADVA